MSKKIKTAIGLLPTALLLIISFSVQAAITVSVETNPEPVLPGEAIQTAITVSNTSVSDSGEITLQLRYPENLNRLWPAGSISNNASCSSYCDPNELVNWSLGILSQGSSITVTLPPVVSLTTPVGTQIDFDIDVFEDAVQVVTTNHTVDVHSSRQFDIAVDESLNPVTPGHELSYNITYANLGSVSTTNTRLSFPLPDGVSFVSASGGGSLNGNIVEWNINTFPARKGGRQTVIVDVNSNVVNGTQLVVDAAEITGVANLLAHSAKAMAVTSVKSMPTMALNLELNPDPIQPGESLTSTIVVSNISTEIQHNVTLWLRYPEHLNRLWPADSISHNASCSSYCDPNEFVNWSLGDLAPGDSIAVTLPPSVIASTPDGSLITFNAAVITDESSSVTRASRSVIVQSASVFDIAVDENHYPVSPGQQLVYSISYSNRSSTSTTNTHLSFPLPEDVSFVSASSGGTLNGNVVEWDLQTFPARKGGKQTVTVNVDSGTVLGSQLEVDAAKIDGQANFLDHSAKALVLTPVEITPALDLKMELNTDPVQPGETLQTTITVSNISGQPIFGVRLGLRYPEHSDRLWPANSISNNATCSSYCDPNEFVSWSLGNLGAGTSISVTLPPAVKSVTPDGTLISFQTEVIEDNGSNTRLSRTVIAQSSPVFDIAVDDNHNPVEPGASLTYSILYSNRSSNSTTNTHLSFPLPEGVSFASASNGGYLNGNTIEWDLQTLPAQRGGRETVTVDVNPSVATGTLLEVDAAIITGEADFLAHSGRALVTTRVEENMPLALTTNISPDPALAGETLDKSISVDNNSGETLFGVTLQLRYPEHLDRLWPVGSISHNAVCSSYCDPNEFVTWSLGTMIPGASIIVDLPPVVNASTTNGTLISSHAIVKEDNGRRVESNQTLLVSSQNYYNPIGQNVPVPDLVGLTQAAAGTAILNAGLSVGSVSTASSNNVAAGKVISHSPGAAENIPQGSSVNMVVSVGSGNLDSDNDLIPDNWENSHGLNPFDPHDASQDIDGDGLSNLQEYQTGTLPNNPDTDVDGILDSWDVTPLIANPNVCSGSNANLSNITYNSPQIISCRAPTSVTGQNVEVRSGATLGIVSQTIWLTDFSAQSGSYFRAVAE